MTEEWPLEQDADIEDPEALRRAEEAVAHEDEGPMGPQLVSDELWVTVATEVESGGGERGLQDVVLALQSEGIDFGWDPRDPLEPVNDPVAGLMGQRPTYSVLVPESELGHALQVLEGVRPANVRYNSLDAVAMSRPREAVIGPKGAPSFTAVTAYRGDHALSDNARLERGEDAASWKVFATAVVLILAVLAATVVYLLLRG